MDIDACAGANTDAWRALADAVLAEFPAAAEFATRCADAKIGTNVESDKLGFFLQTGHVESTYAVRAAHSTAAEAFTKVYEQGPWGPWRLAFESALGCVRAAVYGTLDLPDAVLPEYGPYRLVYEPIDGDQSPVVLPPNSASAYASGTTLDEARLCIDTACWDDRGALATAHRGERSIGVATKEWPSLLGDADNTSSVEGDLIEVVSRQGRRPIDSVLSVRIAAADLESLMERYLRALSGRGVTVAADPDLALGAVTEAARAGIFELVIV